MAARELSAHSNSTPTYIFRITDAASSGVDVGNLQVMMILKFGEENFKYRYLTSVRSSMLNIREDGYWCDPSYCRNLGGGAFAVTVPLWRLQIDTGLDTSTISYQVFLYSTGDITRGNMLSVGDTGDIVIGPGLVRFHNILIDEGTLSIFNSTFPTLVKAEIESIEALGDGKLDEFVEAFGPLSQTSPVSGPRPVANITDDFGYALADLLATQDTSKIDSTIVPKATIAAILAGTTKVNELTDDQFNELFGKTADAVYKYVVDKVTPV